MRPSFLSFFLSSINPLSLPLSTRNVYNLFENDGIPVIARELIHMTGLLGHLESPKFSRIVKRSYYPPSRAHSNRGPIEDLAKASMYRKALSLVAGFPITDIPEFEEELKSQRRAEFSLAAQLELVDRINEFLNVYDVDELYVTYTIEFRDKKERHLNQETYYLMGARKNTPPTLFLLEGPKDRKLNFAALAFVSKRPVSLFENIFSNKALLDMVLNSVQPPGARTQATIADESRRWNKLVAEGMDTYRGGRGGGFGGGGRFEEQGRYPYPDSQATPYRERERATSDSILAYREPNLGPRGTGFEPSSSQPYPPREGSRFDPQAPRRNRITGEEESSNVLPRIFRDHFQEDFDPMGRERDFFGRDSSLSSFLSPFNRPDVGRPSIFRYPELDLEQLMLLRPNKDSPFEKYHYLELNDADTLRDFAEAAPVESLGEMRRKLQRKLTDGSPAEAVYRDLDPLDALDTDIEYDMGIQIGMFGRDKDWNGGVLDSVRKVYKDRVGALAELFMFEYLQKNSQGTANHFDETNWVSSARMFYYPTSDESTVADRLGYDFVYRDQAGVLGGGRNVTYYIEVKGQLGEQRRSIFLSGHEMEIAEEKSRKEDEFYIVACVALKPHPPRIIYWLEDPPKLIKRGLLTLRPSEYTVRIHPSAQDSSY